MLGQSLREHLFQAKSLQERRLMDNLENSLDFKKRSNNLIIKWKKKIFNKYRNHQKKVDNQTNNKVQAI